MQTLRNAHLITRLVLVWFVLFVSAAIASPFVSQTPAPHCAAMEAMKLASAGHDGGGGKSTTQLSCPLCAGICAPPPGTSAAIVQAHPRATAPATVSIVAPTLQKAAPPPARGPPNAA